ncbi:MAG: aminodeoxychorismate lyase [Gammaproteobacteria bacterium]|nr:aminodeoxychorismate lyase [Gammaproteobacteria bacterium]
MLINGQETAHLSALDRAFQYGDGLFETLRIVSGEALHWRRHMARLRRSCERLAIAMPEVELLEIEAQRLCPSVNNGVLKITVTRGQGGRGYAAPTHATATRVLATFAAPAFPATHRTDGVELRWCRTRLGRNPLLAGLKHLNRLEQVLARAEWDATPAEPGIVEGLMQDNHNHVIEGTMSNLFCVRDNVLLTPDLSQCGVAGITRERVMEAASTMNITLRETTLDTAQVLDADELFICNSLIGIWPVRKLEDRCYPVGPVTRQLDTVLAQPEHSAHA